MFIKQISVSLENHNGALREMTELLGKGGVDLLALSVADTQNFGIIRIIVDSASTDSSVKLLRDNGYVAKVNHVICAEVPDRPLGLCELLGLVGEYVGRVFMCVNVTPQYVEREYIPAGNEK